MTGNGPCTDKFPVMLKQAHDIFKCCSKPGRIQQILGNRSATGIGNLWGRKEGGGMCVASSALSLSKDVTRYAPLLSPKPAMHVTHSFSLRGSFHLDIGVVIYIQVLSSSSTTFIPTNWMLPYFTAEDRYTSTNLKKPSGESLVSWISNGRWKFDKRHLNWGGVALCSLADRISTAERQTHR